MIILASNVKVLDILDLCLEISGLRGLSFSIPLLSFLLESAIFSCY